MIFPALGDTGAPARDRSGSVYSAMTSATIPAGRDREAFERDLRAALGPEPYAEDERVTLLMGR